MPNARRGSRSTIATSDFHPFATMLHPTHYDVIVIGGGRTAVAAGQAACQWQAASGERPRQEAEGRATWRGQEDRA